MIRAGIAPIEIELDKKRHLLLTVGGLKRAEIELNKSRGEPRKAIFRMMMDELPQFDQGGMSYDFCEAILWAALLHEDKDLTLDQVGQLPWNLREIQALVLQLISDTYAGMKKTEEPEVIAVESEEEKKNIAKLNGTVDSGASHASSSG